MSLYYSDKIKSTDSSKYGIVDATEVSGHRRVNTLQELYQIPDTILSQSGNNANNDALGQVWYVHGESSEYTLINWASRNNSGGWKKIIPGTITEVKANGTSIATSGSVNIPSASTSAYGVTKLSSATNSTSTSLAATASAVKSAYDLANGRQAKLVSGTNIKTINGSSLLGSGDISILGQSIKGKINLTSIDEIKAAQNALTKTNEVAFYLITDTSGKIPSTQPCYDISPEIVKQLSLRSPSSLTNGILELGTSSINLNPIGVNVGDLIVLTRVMVNSSDLLETIGVSMSLGAEIELYQYKIFSTNDAKPTGHSQSSVGVMGLMSPYDKNLVDQIPNLLPKTEQLPSRWIDNMNNALKTGVYPWCTLGRPAGSTGAYTCIVNKTSTDDGSYNTIEQTAYGREGELGKVFKRIIFEKTDGTDTQYGEWIEVNSPSIVDLEGIRIKSDGSVEVDKETFSPVKLAEINVDGSFRIAPTYKFGEGELVICDIDYTYILSETDGSWEISDSVPTESSVYATKEELAGKSPAYPEINQGTSNTTCTISPNTFYVWGTVSSLDITLGAETSGVANEYLFQFTSGSTATTLELPDNIKWANDSISIEANKTYQISILKGLGSILGFNNA